MKNGNSSGNQYMTLQTVQMNLPTGHKSKQAKKQKRSLLSLLISGLALKGAAPFGVCLPTYGWSLFVKSRSSQVDSHIITVTNHQITQASLSHTYRTCLLSGRPATQMSFPKERLFMRQAHVATGRPQRNKVWGYLWAGAGERCLAQTLSPVTIMTPGTGNTLCSQQKSNY